VSAGTAGGGARVVLHTRPGCHLCDVARSVVREVCAARGEAWAEVDVDAPEHADLRARWTDLVPVVTVDGRHHDHWRIDADRLRGALEATAR
jgi:glutaredoxin